MDGWVGGMEEWMSVERGGSGLVGGKEIILYRFVNSPIAMKKLLHITRIYYKLTTIINK